MRLIEALATAVAVMAVGCMQNASMAESSDSTTSHLDNDSTDADTAETWSACGGGRFRCFARVVMSTTTNGIRKMAAHQATSGFGAADLADAYNLDPTIHPNATVAVIDAYGYKNAESDLAVYRAQFGLPPCTIANGCLQIVNQQGQAAPLPPDPPADDDWTVETALDLDLASAGCPSCKLILVQADDDAGDGLFIAQAAAYQLGATVVSNSWGQSETTTFNALDYEHYFQGFGKMGIFASAGDSGYDNGGTGPSYPSTSAFVTAVGGTTLRRAPATTQTARGWRETAWSGTALTGAGGSSCSLSIPKPTYQGSTSCNFRAASDVAAIGDPRTGAAIYNAGQWQVVGGTSAASPLVAAIYALTGHGSAGPSFSYQHAAAFNDVTFGINGSCGNVLCIAGTGWDGPTGNGTPDGQSLLAIAAE